MFGLLPFTSSSINLPSSATRFNLALYSSFIIFVTLIGCFGSNWFEVVSLTALNKSCRAKRCASFFEKSKPPATISKTLLVPLSFPVPSTTRQGF